MSYNPFTSDEDLDRMNLSSAMQQVTADINNLEEFEMATTETVKPATKKKAPEAKAAPAPTPSRKKVTAAEKPAETKKTAPAAKAPEKASAKPAAASKKPEADLVTVADLAAEAKIAPAVARRILRSKLEKSAEGFRWAWKAGSKELTAARAALAK